ncbi:hypothetical protein LY90DRAFT_664292 [Neocallimastix californiae]|uniref:SNRNP25 ubiquitin-like domain-containing protein n=1 Tax=Neocallimastix californiae TaxID=1754190 RepID=A0A1Y2FAZ9_9FUNG|nr:hypothetical protein LY90DRAFT_664292 [Neocallimastix californiae]|eukprot:ORY81063.1 hypothetical protein LY90DRAFT_664292 [Neocallimastix californiae]
MEKKEIIKKKNLIDYKKCKEELKEILEKLKHETFLKDIKEENFNLEYINLLYKYETGNAYKILIDRGPLPTIEILIKPNATILDLKHQFVKQLNKLYLNNNNNNKDNSKKIKKNFINWTYVWKRYCFSYNGTRLTNDKLTLKEAGFERNTKLQFKKYLYNKKR